MPTLSRRAPVLAALLAAAFVRAWDIDLMALWTDEGLSFYRAGLDVAGILSGMIPVGQHPTRDVQPPLYFLALGGWLRLLGFTAWNAKWLSLLAGLPTIALAWALARRWAGRRAAPWAAWLAALSPVYLWYAQEVRPYALAITLAALGVYALDRGLATAARERGSRGALGWLSLAAAANAALLYSHYLGFFVAGFEVVMAATVLAGPAAAARWRLRAAAGSQHDAGLGSAPGDRAAPGARSSLSALAAVVALVVLVATPLIPFALRRLGTGAEQNQHFYGLHVMLRDMVRGFSLGTALDFERYALPAAALTLGFLL
ncbi:MAG TPA: glycosyltransferase family 39 protein, partial [Gemmatimonadales bacterium]|nr:glycosyltransferase family 39 protein [Gemmatimonadales bacterium]